MYTQYWVGKNINFMFLLKEEDELPLCGHWTPPGKDLKMLMTCHKHAHLLEYWSYQPQDAESKLLKSDKNQEGFSYYIFFAR